MYKNLKPPLPLKYGPAFDTFAFFSLSHIDEKELVKFHINIKVSGCGRTQTQYYIIYSNILVSFNRLDFHLVLTFKYLLDVRTSDFFCKTYGI